MEALILLMIGVIAAPILLIIAHSSKNRACIDLPPLRQPGHAAGRRLGVRLVS